MTARVDQIFRHPIKAHGVEALREVTLKANETMPWDRHWAVAHDASKADASAWARCSNFSRGAGAPQLMAIAAQLNEATGIVTLTHPERPSISFDPDTEASAFLDWVSPLMPKDRAQSSHILSVPGRGMTDSDFPSVSINSAASLSDLSTRMGQELSRLRWRGNIWLEGLATPWEELDWVGKTISIGEAELLIEAPITRCRSTTANPETGERDANTLGALNDLGHQFFGMAGRVAKAGRIRCGDRARLL